MIIGQQMGCFRVAGGLTSRSTSHRISPGHWSLFWATQPLGAMGGSAASTTGDQLRAEPEHGSRWSCKSTGSSCRELSPRPCRLLSFETVICNWGWPYLCLRLVAVVWTFFFFFLHALIWLDQRRLHDSPRIEFPSLGDRPARRPGAGRATRLALTLFTFPVCWETQLGWLSQPENQGAVNDWQAHLLQEKKRFIPWLPLHKWSFWIFLIHQLLPFLLLFCLWHRWPCIFLRIAPGLTRPFLNCL